MKKTFIEGKLFSTGITLGYMAVLFILSVIPDTHSTENPLMLVPPSVQNLAHVPAYGLFALLLIFNLRSSGTTRAQAVKTSITIAFLYGVAMELIQTLVPGRFPSVMDCFLNVAGILVFTGSYLMVAPHASIIWLGHWAAQSKP